jgi:hypothetical protein
MEHLERLTRRSLGEILVAEGLISKDHLEEAERDQARSGDSLSVVLVSSGRIDDRDLARVVTQELQLPYIDISKVSTNSDLTKQLPVEDLARENVVVIDRLGKTMTLAVCEIPDMAFLRTISRKTGLLPHLFVTSLSLVRERYAYLYSGTESSTPVHNLDLEMVGEPEGELVWNPDPEALESGDWGGIFDAGNESVLKKKDPD